MNKKNLSFAATTRGITGMKKTVAPRAQAQKDVARSKRRSVPERPDYKKLVHELQVHQVELEIQNENLREARDAIETSQRRFSDLFNFAPIGYLILDPHGAIKELNLKAASLLGYTRVSLVRKSFVSLIKHEDKNAFLLLQKKLEEEETRQACEIRLITQDRTSLPVILESTVFAGETKTANETMVTIQDISRQKQIEDALRAAKEFSDHLIESSFDGIIAFDKACRFTLRNAAMESMTGVTRDESIGKCAFDLFPFLKENGEDKCYRAALAGKTASSKNRRYVIPQTGREGFYEANYSPIFNNAGEVEGGLGIIRNITERFEAEEKLRIIAAELAETNKELEAFSYSVSHDLRNPLHSIIACSEVLSSDRESTLKKDSKEALEHIVAAGERMSQIITDLLALSRVTTHELQRENVNLSDLARRFYGELKAADPARNIDFAIEPDLVASADSGLVRILVENLIRNAWKYTTKNDHSKIEFGGLNRNGAHVYYVRDNGVGFDMENAERLFQPFQRLHSEKEFKGTGIGLAIVKRIAEKHGGSVRAEGEVGKGATFYFSFD
jgi:PAS domain S-box-containing protein